MKLKRYWSIGYKIRLLILSSGSISFIPVKSFFIPLKCYAILFQSLSISLSEPARPEEGSPPPPVLFPGALVLFPSALFPPDKL
jgi:hypothetical protein